MVYAYMYGIAFAGEYHHLYPLVSAASAARAQKGISACFCEKYYKL